METADGPIIRSVLVPHRAKSSETFGSGCQMDWKPYNNDNSSAHVDGNEDLMINVQLDGAPSFIFCTSFSVTTRLPSCLAIITISVF